MAAVSSSSLRAPACSHPQQQQTRICCVAVTRRPCVRQVCVRAQAAGAPRDEEMARRALLLGGAAAVVAAPALMQGAAFADEGAPAAAAAAEYVTFYGLASPPTSYGGYGGNAKEAAKYTFEYPNGWKQEVPSKVEKGTQGIDGRVVNPKVKDQRAFVITLGRAGEDNKNFRLNDLDSTFAGFAGADYNLQDALSGATSTTKAEREVDGVQFYDYDIDSPEFRYLSSIAVKGGKVFALFVRSPAKAFGRVEPQLRHIIETFRLL